MHEDGAVHRNICTNTIVTVPGMKDPLIIGMQDAKAIGDTAPRHAARIVSLSFMVLTLR